MKPLEYCFELYKKNNYELTNGLRASEEAVASMLEGILTTMVEGLRGCDGNPPPKPNLRDLQMSPDGGFMADNPADIIALIFEVVVEDNGNPTLWGTSGGAGWKGIVNHTLVIFFNGPMGESISNRAAGVHKNTYFEAKTQLQAFLKDSRDLFRF